MKTNKGFSTVGIIATIIVVIFIGIAAFLVIDSSSKATNYNNYDFNSIIAPDEHNGNIGDNVKGNPDAPVVIIEYTDFQCPGCASLNPRVNAAIEKADGNLAVVYRHYRARPEHLNSIAATSAAQAAGLQGYWKPYADLLFLNQADWEYASASERTALFTEYFKEVTNGQGDVEKFQSDLASKEVSRKISFDTGIANRVGVGGTPAFYIDGQFIDWSNKNGGSITVNDKTITWEANLTGEQFEDLLVRIVNAKLED